MNPIPTTVYLLLVSLLVTPVVSVEATAQPTPVAVSPRTPSIAAAPHVAPATDTVLPMSDEFWEYAYACEADASSEATQTAPVIEEPTFDLPYEEGAR